MDKADAVKPLPYKRASEFQPSIACDYIVKGVLRQGVLAAVVSVPGAGKSVWTMNLAAHITSGRAWYGRRVRKGAVLWLALEGQHGLGERLQALRERGLLDEDAPLYIVTVPVALVPNAAAIAATAIHASLNTPDVVLVVIDTLSRALPGVNENDGEVMTAAVCAADSIRAETDAAVLLVHHMGKDQERGPRGHSSLNAALDLQINITANGDDRVASIAKNRDGPGGEQFGFRLERVVVGVDNELDEIASCVAVPTDVPVVVTAPKATTRMTVAVVDYFRQNAAAGQVVAFGAILTHLESSGMVNADSADAARKAVSRCLNAMVADGVLTSSNIPRGYRMRQAVSQ